MLVDGNFLEIRQRTSAGRGGPAHFQRDAISQVLALADVSNKRQRSKLIVPSSLIEFLTDGLNLGTIINTRQDDGRCMTF